MNDLSPHITDGQYVQQQRLRQHNDIRVLQNQINLAITVLESDSLPADVKVEMAMGELRKVCGRFNGRCE